MKRVLLIGGGACVGALIGFGIDMVVKKHKQKEVKENVNKNVNKNLDAVDLAVKTGCIVCASYTVLKVTYAIVDYISEVDTKATVSNILNVINGTKLGIFDKDMLKAVLEASLPTLDKSSKELIEAYAYTAFPELLGGE